MISAERGMGKNGTEANTPSVSASSLLDGWTAPAAGKPRKRSLSIAGHRTAISLEEPFWEALRNIAATKHVAVARLVAEIDAVRAETSLSSAIRLFVLAAGVRDCKSR